MPETMQTTIETIEKDAEKVLEDGRTTARKILDEAKGEVGTILSSDPPMDEVTKERNKIIQTAQEETTKETKAAQKKASQIKARAAKKIDETVQFIINHLQGTRQNNR
jgi:F0F1-type ATP synthase membrane subunit b/b'